VDVGQAGGDAVVGRRERELYVEGGGDHNPVLASECRKAFSKLFARAGISQRPKVIVCGGRKNAYDQFVHAIKEDRADVWLLVDAEEIVKQPCPPFDPWFHVQSRGEDGWRRPPGVSDDQLHLMTATMETWLLVDRAALKSVFGPRLDESRLPPPASELERLPKRRLEECLKTATEVTRGGPYDKGAHSFRVLAAVAPDRLRILPWAERFLRAMGSGG